MLRAIGILALMSGALAISGCTGTATSVDVTRFHLGQAIPRGAIRVIPGNPALSDSLEARQFAEIIGQEATKAGFQAQGGKALQVIEFAVTREARDAGSARSPVTVGIGGGTGGNHVGIGGGISFPIGQARARQLVATELHLRLRRESDNVVIWEGRARTEGVATTAAADPRTAITRLAAALFTGFPGESGKTITVK